MKYDFSKIEKKEKKSEAQSGGANDEDPRKNLRITKCCGNCKYFAYIDYYTLAGECKMGNLKTYRARGLRKVKNMKELREFGKKNGWLPVFYSNLCDRHEMKGKTAITAVEKHTNKKFNFDGTLNLDDVDI